MRRIIVFFLLLNAVFMGMLLFAWQPSHAQLLPTRTPLAPILPSVVPLPLNPTPTQLLITAPTLPPTALPGIFPTNTPRFTYTPTPVAGDHLWFARPFARDPSGQISDTPARGYAYGSTGGGLQLHHGIDIQNPTGTQVLSIGNGRVFYAGDDLSVIFGPAPDFYGNVVVIEHDYLSPSQQRIYSLYGHLSRVLVATGDSVGYGSVIGAVGSEGVALGPHLHLEIRLDKPYDYYSTVNPELWITPWEGFGIFAARVTDPNGNLIPNVRLELIGSGVFMAGTTYASDLVDPDPYYGENIVIGDLRRGQYDLKVGEIRNILYKTVVQIEPGRVNVLDIQLELGN